MNPLGPYTSRKNSYPRCAESMALAERELSAFFHTITQLFGATQARLSAETWLRELIEIDGLPASAREWRFVTVAVLSRLASEFEPLAQKASMEGAIS